MNIETLRDDLERDGFAILPPLLPDAVLDDVSLSIEHQSTLSPSVGKRGLFAVRHLLERIPVVRELAQSEVVRNLMCSLLGSNARVVRGLLFDKTPQANWKVPWHQDLTIAVCERREVDGFGPWSVKEDVVHVQPPAKVLCGLLTLRLHLDACDETNGPLRVLPGSHRAGKLSSTEIEAQRANGESSMCIAPRGGIVLMKPLLLHASSPCASPRHRRVVHLEWSAQELPHGLQWHERV